MSVTYELVHAPTATKKTLEEYCVRLGLKRSCNKKEELIERLDQALGSPLPMECETGAAASTLETPTLAPKRKVSLGTEVVTLGLVQAPSVTKTALEGYCVSLGLKKSGKKEELVERLVRALEGVPNPGPIKKVKTSPPKVAAAMAVFMANSGTPVTEVCISKNKFGNHEDTETGIVFRNVTGSGPVAVGTQCHETGKVIELDVTQIEVCKQHKWVFLIPPNLNLSKETEEINAGGGDSSDDGASDVEEDVEFDADDDPNVDE